jgi:hypothetical protein
MGCGTPGVESSYVGDGPAVHRGFFRKPYVDVPGESGISSTEFNYIGYINGLNYWYLTIFFAAIILAIMSLAPSSSPEFIYFQY